MKPVRNPVLSAALVAGALVAGALAAVVGPGDRAAALPVPQVAWRATGPEAVQFACGPYRCGARPFWRYGDRRGFFPMRRFGPPPARRFGYRPFGFGRFGGPRRW